MPGTVEGGRKAAATNRERHGLGFYGVIGSVGGQKSKGGGFTNPDIAKSAGRKGGSISRRRPKESYPDTRILTTTKRPTPPRDAQGRFRSGEPKQDWGLSSPESRAALAELAPRQADVDVIPNLHYFIWMGSTLTFGAAMFLLGARFF